MPAVAFSESSLGPAVRADVPEGGRLLDVCDEARAPVAFSCRSASCSTCLVEVIEGAALLDPPGRDEREVLDLFLAAPDQRLACQAVIRKGAGLIKLRWIGDEARTPSGDHE